MAPDVKHLARLTNCLDWNLGEGNREESDVIYGEWQALVTCYYVMDIP